MSILFLERDLLASTLYTHRVIFGREPYRSRGQVDKGARIWQIDWLPPQGSSSQSAAFYLRGRNNHCHGALLRDGLSSGYLKGDADS